MTRILQANYVQRAGKAGRLMAALSERLNTPISTSELERRWTAVRAAMAREKIDVLVIQNNNDHMGGYVRYFTDLPAGNGYPATVIFPRDDLMTMVCQGPFDQIEEMPAGGDGVRRGLKRVLTTPSYASAFFTNDYDPELAGKALAPFASGVVGLVGLYQMSFALVDYLKLRFTRAKFVDASDLVDRIKAIKSGEERALIARTARMQDGAMRAAFEAVKPGMRDSDVVAAAQFYSQTHGSEQGLYLCASAPLGGPLRFGPRHMQNRTIRRGDYLALLVEDNGPGGFYTELGRTCVLGTVPQQMKDELALTLESRELTLEMLKPDSSPKEIWERFNAFMRSNGRPAESRLYCHGQGYDMVERPLIRHDEPMAVCRDMNIVVHPTYVHNNMLSWICDNYLIEADGPGPRLHGFPQEVVEIDC